MTEELQRVLEPEVMDTVEDATEYASMDHAEANAALVGRLLELGVHGRVLDIGTGPGDIPLLLCDRLPEVHVTGIDLAQTMLDVAERNRAGSAHAARVEFRIADAKGLEFEDASYDSVFSNTILHHIPDPVPFLSEALRVLKPGGCLLVRDLMRPSSQEELERLVALYAANDTPYQRRLFRDSLHAAFRPEEIRELAQRAGLAAADVVVDSDRHLSIQIAAG